MMDLLKELWLYAKLRRNWIVVPLFAFIVLLGFLLIFAEKSVFAPIIYTFF